MYLEIFLYKNNFFIVQFEEKQNTKDNFLKCAIRKLL